jgi:hypothetical protein
MFFNDFNVLYKKYIKNIIEFSIEKFFEKFFLDCIIKNTQKRDCQMYYNILGYSFFALDRNML